MTKSIYCQYCAMDSRSEKFVYRCKREASESNENVIEKVKKASMNKKNVFFLDIDNIRKKIKNITFEKDIITICDEDDTKYIYGDILHTYNLDIFSEMNYVSIKKLFFKNIYIIYEKSFFELVWGFKPTDCAVNTRPPIFINLQN